MKCYYCHVDIPEGATECSNCGANVVKPQQKETIKSINPYKWRVRDWLFLAAAFIVSIFTLQTYGIAIGLLGWILLYTYSLRWLIWPDLRALAAGKPELSAPITKRIVNWVLSQEGAYQRTAGYLGVISGLVIWLITMYNGPLYQEFEANLENSLQGINHYRVTVSLKNTGKQTIKLKDIQFIAYDSAERILGYDIHNFYAPKTLEPGQTLDYEKFLDMKLGNITPNLLKKIEEGPTFSSDVSSLNGPYHSLTLVPIGYNFQQKNMITAIAILLGITALVALFLVGKSWLQPWRVFKRGYEWVAIGLIILLNIILVLIIRMEGSKEIPYQATIFFLLIGYVFPLLIHGFHLRIMADKSGQKFF